MVIAQNNITNSPYSLYGIGDPLAINNTMGLSMGDTKYALDRPFYLNTANPASYASLKAATFSVGAMLNRTRTFNATTSQDNDNGTLRYFGLGIPITKKIGIALGAKPFTSFGYGIQVSSPDQSQGATYSRYEGQGGMNIVHMGMGYEVFSDSAHKFTIGSNLNYYFGNKQQITLNNVEAIPGALNAAFIESSVTGDFAFDFGALYAVNIPEMFGRNSNNTSKLTFGASYSLGTYLKTKFESFAGPYYYNNARLFVITDTLRYSQDTNSIYLPAKYGFGVNYEFFNRTSRSLLILEADYEHYGWSDLKINGKPSNVVNSDQVSFGLQFVPNMDAKRAFFKTMRYRVGAKYKSTRIDLAGDPLKDISGSLGFGIPLVKSKSIYADASTFDFGVMVGNRGTVDNGLIREQYTNIYLGLSLSPSFWDRWFKKRKIK